MRSIIETHRETVLDSPYSRDREEAIEELGDVFPDAGADGGRQILETLRQVSRESSSRSERELARDQLAACFDTDPGAAAPVAVEAFCGVAAESKFTDERLDAMDRLRELYPRLDDQHRDAVGKTLADIAGNATRERERRRARHRLSDISRDERSGTAGAGGGDGTDAGDYLARSLAEHLERAAHEGPEECLRRAKELGEFLSENPTDGSYREVRDEVEALVEQLEVVPTGNELDEERRAQVERLAARVERMYV